MNIGSTVLLTIYVLVLAYELWERIQLRKELDQLTRGFNLLCQYVFSMDKDLEDE